MTEPTNIERTVMRRVHTIRRLRPLVSGAALAFFVFALALWGIGREVWVAKVLENAPRDILALPRFYMAAFAHTKLAVQILSLMTAGALIALAHSTAKALASLLPPLRA